MVNVCEIKHFLITKNVHKNCICITNQINEYELYLLKHPSKCPGEALVFSCKESEPGRRLS